MKWNLVKLLGVAGVAITLVGCPELSLKGTIRALAAPSNVGGMKVVPAGSKQFKVAWKDPTDPDVDHIEISLRAPMTTDAPPAPVTVPLGVQTAMVSVPYNNVQYIVVVKAVDKGGNKSPGSVYTPLSLQSAFAAASLTGTLLLPSTQAYVKTQSGGYSSYPLTTAGYEYDYAYNTSNLLVSETDYTLGPKTQDGYQHYTYDFRGNLTEHDYYDSTSTYVSYDYVYQYDSTGNQTASSYYTGGTVSSLPTLYSSDSYQYDSNGNQIQDNSYNNVGALQNSIVYQYDSNNRLVKGTEYDNTGAVQYVITVQWNDASGFPSYMAITDNTGALFLSIAWSATPGVLSANITVNLFGSATYTVTSTFDQHGLLQGTSSTESGSDHLTFSYDIDGNRSQQVEYDSTNAFVSGLAWTY